MGLPHSRFYVPAVGTNYSYLHLSVLTFAEISSRRSGLESGLHRSPIRLLSFLPAKPLGASSSLPGHTQLLLFHSGKELCFCVHPRYVGCGLSPLLPFGPQGSERLTDLNAFVRKLSLRGAQELAHHFIFHMERSIFSKQSPSIFIT